MSYTRRAVSKRSQFALFSVADRGEPVEHRSPNRADARATLTHEVAKAAMALVARHGERARNRPPLCGHARGRRGRLPARARDPADQGAERSRGGAAAVAAHGRQARGVRAAPPARPADAGQRRRRAGRAIDARGGDARAGRALRAAAPGRRGAAATQAAGDPLPRPAGARAVLPGDLRADRMDLHEGEPLPDRGSPGAEGSWPASRADRSATGWRRCCPPWPTARRPPTSWRCCDRT